MEATTRRFAPPTSSNPMAMHILTKLVCGNTGIHYDTLGDLDGFDPDMQAGRSNVCRRNAPKFWRVPQSISLIM